MELDLKTLKLKSNTNKVRLRILNKMIKKYHKQYLSLKEEIKDISENIVFLKEEYKIASIKQHGLDLKISNSIETSTQNIDDDSIVICKNCQKEHYIGQENITSGVYDTYFHCSKCHSKIILFSNNI